MKFYKISIEYIPGEEGDNWIPQQRYLCKTCNRKYVSFKNRFITDDDWIDKPSLYFDDEDIPPFFRIAGLYFVSEDTKFKIEQSLENNFEFKQVDIENLKYFKIFWIKSLGRITIEPLYYSISNPCLECKTSIQTKIDPRPNVPKYKILENSWTGKYLFRAEEYSSPDFVDEEFMLFINEITKPFAHKIATFKEIEICANYCIHADVARDAQRR